MTTATVIRSGRGPLQPAHRTGFGRLVRAEWTKIRSVRSTVWSLGILVVAAIGLNTGNQANAYATIRNLVIGAFRRAGFANIAHARRCYGRDDQRILALYGYN